MFESIFGQTPLLEFTVIFKTQNLFNLRLNKVAISKTDLVLLSMAFLAYTGMYAARKAFLAGQYEEIGDLGSFHFKTLLIISQVMGYMLSKFIGIKVVSELSVGKRFGALVSLVGFSILMLMAFAIVPDWLKPVAMFLNGLPLGMIFGIVLIYLEGRRNSELLVAGLSATFIFSTGFVKSIGLWLMGSFGIPELWMPFATGLLFFPMFIASSFILSKVQGPSTLDIELRTERKPMERADRIKFLKKHGGAFLFLVLIYVLLTIVRDFRDNFIVEFWKELGMSGQPELITFTEIPIAMVVLLISAAGILILDNKSAFRSGMFLTLLGAALMILATILFGNQLMDPILWMIVSGFSIYLPYILFHCLIFERFIAVLRFKGTVGFLFYIADAFGYLGSVGIMLYKELASPLVSWVNFFTRLNLVSGMLIILFVLACLLVMKTNAIKRKLSRLEKSLF